MSERYIKLNGDAIHEPLWKSLHRSQGIRLTGLMCAFNMASLMYMNPGMTLSQKLLYLGLCAGSYGGTEYLFRRYEHMNLRNYFQTSVYKCIDQKPDSYTPPTDISDYKKSRNYVLCGLVGFGGPIAMLIAARALAGQSFLEETLKGLAETLTDPEPTKLPTSIFPYVFLSRSFQSMYRFYKVLKEDHVTTSLPPKEEARKPVLAPSPA